MADALVGVSGVMVPLEGIQDWLVSADTMLQVYSGNASGGVLGGGAVPSAAAVRFCMLQYT
jgi:hypothetical protein